jgi:hypothetical protein
LAGDGLLPVAAASGEGTGVAESSSSSLTMYCTIRVICRLMDRVL